MASAEQVRTLRAKTGAGIMECRRALVEAGEDLDKAIDLLRKQGVVKAAKKADRATNEGRIELAVSSNGDRAAIIEANCETDFVARTDEFQQFVKMLARHVLATASRDVDSFLDAPLEAGSEKTVRDTLQEMVAKVGENISIPRLHLSVAKPADVTIGSYVHAGNQIGVIAEIKGNKATDIIVRDVAMHIAAMHPSYVSPDRVPEDVAQKEKEILRESPDMADKPDDVAEKMVAGRYRKFLSQVCLTEQIFIKDPQGKQTVGAYLRSVDPNAEITSFVRFQVGEK